jgi:hypothetical protein
MIGDIQKRPTTPLSATGATLEQADRSTMARHDQPLKMGASVPTNAGW